jgi:hypothetical protein
MKNRTNLNNTQEEDSSSFLLTSGIHLNFGEDNEDLPLRNDGNDEC